MEKYEVTELEYEIEEPELEYEIEEPEIEVHPLEIEMG